jgi:SPP1 family phage portal protein
MEKELLKHIKKHTDEKARYEKLQNYYEAKTDILERKFTDTTKPNNQLVNSYSSYIVDIILGYFIGNPISYTANNDELMEKIQAVFDDNEERVVNQAIAKQMGIKGKCYEIVFVDEESKIKFTKVNADDCFIVYSDDIIPKKLYAVRMYKIDTDRFVDVYDAETIRTYKHTTGKLDLIDQVQHFFKKVPVIEYINNEETTGDFEKVITLIDAYDRQRSNTQNDFDYFTDCYMMMTGMINIDTETVAGMKKNRLLLMPEGTKAEFLTKNINDTAIENHLERLKKDIHKFSSTPDLTDENFGTSISGIALQFKMFGLSQIAIQKENYMRKGLYERLELIINMLQVKGMSENYNKDDITILFKRNMPTNVKEIVEMVLMLKGIVSDETVLSLLPFVEDINSELEKVKEQQGESLDNFVVDDENE